MPSVVGGRAFRLGDYCLALNCTTANAVPAPAHGAEQLGTGRLAWRLCHTGHGVVWVDDFIFYKLVSAHAACMIEFSFPNSRALLPTLPTNCPSGSHFAQMGSHFAQITAPNPCSLLSHLLSHHTPFWDMYVHKTSTSPPENTPFPGLNLKIGKINYRLGNLDPNRAKCLKSGQIFLEVGKKKILVRPGQASKEAAPSSSSSCCRQKRWTPTGSSCAGCWAYSSISTSVIAAGNRWNAPGSCSTRYTSTGLAAHTARKAQEAACLLERVVCHDDKLPSVTARFLDGVRGRVMHYSACILYTRVLVTEILTRTGALLVPQPRIGLGGRLDFFRNDAEAAFAVLRKGSSNSQPMQAGSLEFSPYLTAVL